MKSDASLHSDAPHGLGKAAQWWLIVCVTATAMVAQIDKNILALLVAPIRKDLGLTDTQMGFLLGTAFALVYTASILPAGPLADRFRRKYIVAGGIAFWSVMTMACGLAGTYVQLFLARMGVGAGEGSIQPSLYSLVRSGVDDSRRGSAFSLLSLAPMLGAGLAVILGGALIGAVAHLAPLALPFGGTLQTWQITLVCVGVVGFPFALLALSMQEPARASTGGQPAQTYAQTLRFMRGQWVVYACLIAYATMNQMISASLGAWIPSILMRQQGLTPMQIGATFGTLMITVGPLGALISAVVIDRATRVGNVRVPIWAGVVGLAVLSVSGALAVLQRDASGFWMFFTVQVLFGALPGATANVLLAHITPAALMGKVAAINLLVMGFLGVATAPALAALIGDHIFAHEGPRSIGHGVGALLFTVGMIGVALMLAVAYRLRPARPA